MLHSAKIRRQSYLGNGKVAEGYNNHAKVQGTIYGLLVGAMYSLAAIDSLAGQQHYVQDSG